MATVESAVCATGSAPLGRKLNMRGKDRPLPLGRGALMVSGLAVLLVAAGCSSSSKNSSSTTTGGASSSTTAAGAATTVSGNTASAPGVSATTYKVALVTSLTGSDSSNSINIPKGFAARIDAQNAAGGVNGRKITYVVED